MYTYFVFQLAPFLIVSLGDCLCFYMPVYT